MRKRLVSVALIAIAASLVVAGNAAAATITVTSGADPGDNTTCTLAQAVASADTDDASGSTCAAGSPNDTIVFAPSVTGAITLASTLNIDPVIATGTLHIQGPGSDTLAISGNDTVRVVRANADIAHAVTISGLTIELGRVASTGPNPTTLGAGIENAGKLTLDHVHVTNNTTTATETSTTTAFAASGGTGIDNSGQLAISDSVIDNNAAFANATTGTLSDTALALGAGIFSQGTGTTLSLTDSSVANNETHSNATTGASLSTQSSGVGIVSQNSAQPNALVITRSTIANNVGATTTANTESGIGGGLYVNVSGSITSSTIAGNNPSTPVAAPTLGGGLLIAPGSNLTLTGNTIAGNSSDTGANLYHQGGTSILEDTILADPIAGGNCSIAGGTLASNGHNLTSDATCPLVDTGDITNSPTVNLGTLANHGGPTETRVPGPNSSAIDKGIVAGQPTDQRGLQRTWQFDTPDDPDGDGTDIGAVEVQGPTVTSTNPASPSTNQSPVVKGTVEPASTVDLHATGDCSDSAIGTGPEMAFPGIGIPLFSPLAVGSTTVFHATSHYGTATSACSPSSVAYTVLAPPPSDTGGGSTTTPAPTPAPAPAPTKKKKCKKKARKGVARTAKKCKRKK